MSRLAIPGLLIVLSMFFMLGCNVTKKSSEDEGEVVLSKTFTADSGYSIDYPEDWTVSANELESRVKIIGVVNSLGKSPEELIIYQNNTTEALGVVFDLVVSGLESAGVEAVVTGDVTINAQAARRVDYTTTNSTVKGITIVSVVDSIKYQLTYLGATVYTSGDIVAAMIDSFRF